MSYLLSSILTIQLAPNKHFPATKCSGMASVIAMLGLALMLSACQKSPDTKAESKGEPSVASHINNNQHDSKSDIQNAAPADDPNLTPSNELSASQAPNTPLSPLESTPNPETLTPQQPRGTQVTDVQYRSAAGETLSVVFETSATGVLNAVITLSNGTTLTLSAPEGQGNNPTYRSADGKIELVSHQGGTVIDLIRNDIVTSFTAVSAEAEVITQT